MVFQVVTDAVIRQGYLLRNVRLLTDYARYSMGPDDKARIIGLLLRDQTMTIGDLVGTLCAEQPQAAVPPILHLTYHHQLVIPLHDTPLSLASPVSLPLAEPRPALARLMEVAYGCPYF